LKITSKTNDQVKVLKKSEISNEKRTGIEKPKLHIDV